MNQYTLLLKTTTLALLFIFNLAVGYAQEPIDSVDTNLWLGINLHHQIPSFKYSNKKIEVGIFEKQIIHEGNTYTIQGGFKNFKSDGLWVAKDSLGTARLLALFHSDTLIFLHLNDTLGRPAHHFTYKRGKLLNQEWYHNGKLIQYDEYINSERIVTSFHENMKHRLTFFIDENGITYKKWVYDKNGIFIKESYDVNE